jgi:putative membrane protein
MGYWDNDHMNDGRGILLMVSMLAIWALVVLVVVWVIRSGRTPAAGMPGPAAPGTNPLGNAEQILAERLARGDIDPEEYRTRLDALRSGRT